MAARVRVNIAGATGMNASAVNGTYDRSVEVVNGKRVYNKVGDTTKCLFYSKNKKWMVAPTVVKDQNKTTGWAASSATKHASPELEIRPWSVYNPALRNWGEQRAVTVVDPDALPVTIAGATGTNACTVNGTYVRSAEVVNGKRVYNKVGDTAKCLFYSKNKKWMVARTADKDQNKTTCWAMTMITQHASPELEPRIWQVYNSSSWEEQRAMTVSANSKVATDCIYIANPQKATNGTPLAPFHACTYDGVQIAGQYKGRIRLRFKRTGTVVCTDRASFYREIDGPPKLPCRVDYGDPVYWSADSIKITTGHYLSTGTVGFVMRQHPANSSQVAVWWPNLGVASGCTPYTLSYPKKHATITNLVSHLHVALPHVPIGVRGGSLPPCVCRHVGVPRSPRPSQDMWC